MVWWFFDQRIQFLLGNILWNPIDRSFINAILNNKFKNILNVNTIFIKRLIVYFWRGFSDWFLNYTYSVDGTWGLNDWAMYVWTWGQPWAKYSLPNIYSKINHKVTVHFFIQVGMYSINHRLIVYYSIVFRSDWYSGYSSTKYFL